MTQIATIKVVDVEEFEGGENEGANTNRDLLTV